MGSEPREHDNPTLKQAIYELILTVSHIGKRTHNYVNDV